MSGINHTNLDKDIDLLKRQLDSRDPLHRDYQNRYLPGAFNWRINQTIERIAQHLLKYPTELSSKENEIKILNGRASKILNENENRSKYYINFKSLFSMLFGPIDYETPLKKLNSVLSLPTEKPSGSEVSSVASDANSNLNPTQGVNDTEETSRSEVTAASNQNPNPDSTQKSEQHYNDTEETSRSEVGSVASDDSNPDSKRAVEIEVFETKEDSNSENIFSQQEILKAPSEDSIKAVSIEGFETILATENPTESNPLDLESVVEKKAKQQCQIAETVNEIKKLVGTPNIFGHFILNENQLIGFNTAGEFSHHTYTVLDTKKGGNASVQILNEVAIRTLDSADTSEQLKNIKYLEEIYGKEDSGVMGKVHTLSPTGPFANEEKSIYAYERYRSDCSEVQFTQEEAPKMSDQLIKAIAKAFEKGIIVTDLKPANVSYHGNGQIKLQDLGSSLSIQDPQAIYGKSPAYYDCDFLQSTITLNFFPSTSSSNEPSDSNFDINIISKPELSEEERNRLKKQNLESIQKAAKRKTIMLTGYMCYFFAKKYDDYDLINPNKIGTAKQRIKTKIQTKMDELGRNQNKENKLKIERLSNQKTKIDQKFDTMLRCMREENEVTEKEKILLKKLLKENESNSNRLKTLEDLKPGKISDEDYLILSNNFQSNQTEIKKLKLERDLAQIETSRASKSCIQSLSICDFIFSDLKTDLGSIYNENQIEMIEQMRDDPDLFDNEELETYASNFLTEPGEDTP